MNELEKKLEKDWEIYQKEKANKLYPNIALLGKSGAGKSTLINTIFETKVAKVSNIKPETKGFYNIYYGKDYHRFVNLIDTAGYEINQGEVYYNNILSLINNGIRNEPIHIIWYCISITNERIEDIDIKTIIKLLREKEIRKRLFIVFTKCDYDTETGEKASKLKTVLNNELKKLNIAFSLNYFEVCDNQKDFPLDLPKLIEKSAEILDNVDLRKMFIASQLVNLDIKKSQAQEIINAAVKKSGIIGATPIPMSDAPFLITIQYKMTADIIDIYGISNIVSMSVKTIIKDVFIANLGKKIVATLLNVIPIIGSAIAKSLISAGVAATITYALGMAISEICYKAVKDFLNGKNVNWDDLLNENDLSIIIKQYM